MSLPWWVMGRIAAALAAIAAGLTTLTLWCVARAGARRNQAQEGGNNEGGQ